MVPVPFFILVSLGLLVPFLEIIIMLIFIKEQVLVPPAALLGPARQSLNRCLFLEELLLAPTL